VLSQLEQSALGPALRPNGRSFALAVHAAMRAKEAQAAATAATASPVVGLPQGLVEGRSAVSAMLRSGTATPDTLYEHFQPQYLRRMTEQGFLTPLAEADARFVPALSRLSDGAPERDSAPLLSLLLDGEPLSRRWCFLTAAAQASKGDQFGSKHGAVLVAKGGAAGAGSAAGAPAVESAAEGAGPEKEDSEEDGTETAAGSGAVAVSSPLPSSSTCSSLPSHRLLLGRGRNHRYGVPGDPHLRVMHSEVHCLVQHMGRFQGQPEAEAVPAGSTAAATGADGSKRFVLSSVQPPTAPDAAEDASADDSRPKPSDSELAAAAHAVAMRRVPSSVKGKKDRRDYRMQQANPHPTHLPLTGSAILEDTCAHFPMLGVSEVFVVELDAHGVGYEEAVPCPQCSTALCNAGVRRASFSSHSGVRSTRMAHRRGLPAETLLIALSRIYPARTACPDGDTAMDDAWMLGGGATAAAGGPRGRPQKGQQQ
jgi:hypothetical protein